MNETFPATPISVETFAQRLIALDTLRHAIVDLWEFWQRERNADGFSTADILRLEEIRQIVAAERPLLPASRETANQFKEILRSRGVFPEPFDSQVVALRLATISGKSSPREKSNPNEQSTSAPLSHYQPAASAATVAPAVGRKRSAAKATHKTLSAGRSAPAARKAGRAVRGGGKKRRRGKRPAR